MGHTMQVFSKMYTSKWWWSVQVCMNSKLHTCLDTYIIFSDPWSHANQAQLYYQLSSHQTRPSSPFSKPRVPIQFTWWLVIFPRPFAASQLSKHNCWWCQGPSHGGSYMDEGMSHIRIRLPPRVVSEDHLASAVLLGLLIVHMRMIQWSGWYRVVLVRHVCLWAPEGCFLLPTLSACMVSCIPWQTTMFYNWWRVSGPASADALQVSLWFYY